MVLKKKKKRNDVEYAPNDREGGTRTGRVGQGSRLEERLEFHVNKLSGITEEHRQERDVLLKEKSEHITMDDLYDGSKFKVIYSFGGSFFILVTLSTIPTVCSLKTRTCPSDTQD